MGKQPIDTIRSQDDRRLDELKEWLAQFDNLGDAKVTPASIDASFRRYFRVQTNGLSRIVMDAPPEQEDCRPFVRVAGYLEQMGLNSARVLQASPERGFLLLTDLGSRQYLDELEERPERADELYGAAIDALATLQARGTAFQSGLPPYDAGLLELEMALFRDWLCGRHLGIEFSRKEEIEWQGCVRLLVGNALKQPRVFVHRDYHSRNLMVTGDNSPGMLDFQDAMEGPLTYDLVSLLKDCYICWPEERVRAWALGFHASLAQRVAAAGDPAEFLQSFDLMGVQRHLKAAGIFARLCHRDGKAWFLHDVPRTLAYIVAVAGHRRELSFLAQLIAERCLPAFHARAYGNANG